MLKQTVTFKGFFDDKLVTKNLYFNLGESDLMEDGLWYRLQDEMQVVHDMLSEVDSANREMEPQEIQKLLDLTKKFMEMSYGERRGDEFVKFDPLTGAKLWNTFKGSAAYDAFVVDMFKKSEAFAFIVAVLPESFRGDLTKQLAAEGLSLDDLKGTEAPAIAPELEAGEPVLNSSSSDGEDEKRAEDFTRNELLAMTDDEFLAVAGTNPMKMSNEVLQVAMQRKNR